MEKWLLHPCYIYVMWDCKASLGFFQAELIADDELLLRKWICFLNSVLHGNSWPVSIAVRWLFCSWLILSNSFTSVERRFHFESTQRFGSTNWSTGFRKYLFNPPIIDFLIYNSWNTSSFAAEHIDSFVVHCVPFATLTCFFNLGYK